MIVSSTNNESLLIDLWKGLLLGTGMGEWDCSRNGGEGMDLEGGEKVREGEGGIRSRRHHLALCGLGGQGGDD